MKWFVILFSFFARLTRATHKATVMRLSEGTGTRRYLQAPPIRRLTLIMIMTVSMAATSGCWGQKSTSSPSRAPDQTAAISQSATTTNSTTTSIGASSSTVGVSGGVIASDDGNVRVRFPAGAAAPGTSVAVTVNKTPTGTDNTPAVIPLTDFAITAKSGAIHTGEVTVHYDAAAVVKGGSTPELLVMLISDDNGNWTALPTNVDSIAHTVTANWPHFSRGRLGFVKSPVSWLVDHVLTYPLGPKKDPNCTRDGWLGRDQGWTAQNPNWDNGRILINPLDACVETLKTGSSMQRVEVTNRYWYSMLLSLPKGAKVTFDNAIDAPGIGSALLTEVYWHLFGMTLIPGHSSAHFEVPTSPLGQTMTMNSYADPVSYVVDALMTITEFATLGEAKAARAELLAAEDELYAGVKTGVETNASAAEKLAPGSEWRESHEKKGDRSLAQTVDMGLNGAELVNCAVDALKEQISTDKNDQSHNGNWKRLEGLLTKVVDSCKKELAIAVLGKAYEFATGNKAELVENLVKGLLDTKSLQSTSEGINAMAAELVGKDYLRSRLILSQARDPRLAAGSNHVMTNVQAVAMSGAHDPQTCVPMPTGWVLPSVLTAVSCVNYVYTDLDGNGKKDVLVIWHQISGGQPPPGSIADEGAVAFLDDNTSTTLASPFNKWHPSATYSPVVTDAAISRSIEVVSLRGDRSQQVLFAAASGATTNYMYALVLGADRQLHLATSSDGVPAVFPWGGGVNYPSSIGCVQSDGKNYLSATNVVPAGDGSVNSNGASQWSINYFYLSDTTFIYAGRAGGYSATAVVTLPESGAECSAVTLPVVDRIAKEPLDPATAAAFIIQAATVPGQGLPIARAVIGGPDTDGLWASGNLYDGGRIWKTLIDRTSKDPTAWNGHPPTCSAPAHPNNPRNWSDPPTLVRCSVTPADTTGKLEVLTEKTANGWVVIGVMAEASATSTSPRSGFITKTGNIRCWARPHESAHEDVVDCSIVRTDFVEHCDIQPGVVMSVGAAGQASYDPCQGDYLIPDIEKWGIPTYVPPYGSSVNLGVATCDVSETGGVTCRNAAGHGFTLSRSSHVPF